MFSSRLYKWGRTFFKKETRCQSAAYRNKKRIFLNVEYFEDRFAPATLQANFVGATINIALTYIGTAAETTTVSRTAGLYQFSNPTETITVTGTAAARFTGS